MAQPKGSTGNPNGRPKGSPNKSTAQAREAIAAFVDGNADRLNKWLDQIESEDGSKDAFNCFTSLLEYHVPKLTRSELTGANGGAIKTETKLAEDDKAILEHWKKHGGS